MKRLPLPAIPFLLSLALSASTAGSHVYWQDSGFYLVAVRDLGILYPTGFALYLVLAKAWTLLLFFVDFTRAVHLFSSLCAALAAAALTRAAQEFLGRQGPLLGPRAPGAPDSPGAAAAAVATGCLAAAGYTFWAAAILAKVYAFSFLVLALLLWRMIRADATGRPRDFMIAAALAGLAWQAHPSAVALGPALLLFALAHRGTLRAGQWVGAVGLGAFTALGPCLLLPLFAAREPAFMMGDPRTLRGFWDYLSGSRFTHVPGVFGLAGSRVSSVGSFFWEEFLGVGGVALAAGLLRFARTNRRLLGALAAWVLPVLGMTVLFKMEGQHEFWFVSAWLPLWLVAAAGFEWVGRAAGARGRLAIAGLAIAGTVWSVASNHADLDVRSYTLAESMGHYYLDSLDRGATVVLRSDNPLSTTLYLQRIRGVRPDVAIISASDLQDEGAVRRLLRKSPHLHPPAFPEPWSRFPAVSLKNAQLAAFANANALDPAHPLYFEVPPAAELLRPDAGLAAAGPLQKIVARGGSLAPEQAWTTPVDAEAVARVRRRERAQFNEYLPNEVRVRPESYEHRFLRELLRARKAVADRTARAGTPEAFRESALIYEKILELDPWMREDPGAVFPLAGAYFGMRRYDLAEPWLKKALDLRLPRDAAAQACRFLAAICTSQNRASEAAAWESRARSVSTRETPEESGHP